MEIMENSHLNDPQIWFKYPDFPLNLAYIVHIA